MPKQGVFRQHLKGCSEQVTGSEFDRLDSIRHSRLFTKIFVRDILLKLSPGWLPEDEEDLVACYVDGPNDGGVDFISRQDNHVVIIQAKYHGMGKKQAAPGYARAFM